jgi:hypothetical protein
MKPGSKASAAAALLFALRFAVVSAAAATTGSALAGALGEHVNAHASVSVLQDDNLFRRETDVRSEALFRAGAGLAASLELGGQSLELDVRVSDNQFENARELDYVGAVGGLAFDWQIGSRLDGAVKYAYSRNLTNFEQFRIIEKDIATRNDGRASIGFFVTPRLQLRGELRGTDRQHSSPGWRGAELEETQYGASLMLRTRAGTFIGIGTRRTDGKYPHRSFGPASVVDTAYEQASSDLIVEWGSGGKTSLNMRIGRSSREQEHLSDRDFSARTGDIEVEYAPTAKTRLSLSYIREVRSIDEAFARAALVDRLEFSPAWQASRRLTVSAYVILRRDDFIGLSGVQHDGRVDDDFHVATQVLYAIRGRFSLELGVGRGSRQSTQPGVDYDYLYGSAGVRVSL